MGRFLITGRQGSGKTTVIKRLDEKGYIAYNTDDIPESTKLENIETGEVVEWPEGAVDWSKYAWKWQRNKIEELLQSGDNVFVGAIVAGQINYYDMFDQVFVLIVDNDSIRRRLSSHEHDSHKLPGEIDRIVAKHEEKQKKLVTGKAEPVDANRSCDEIVEEILQRIKDSA